MITGHNITSFLKILTGQGPADYDATALTNFIATTKWKPEPSIFIDSMFEGFRSYTSSHTKEQTRELYQKHLKSVTVYNKSVSLDEDEVVPMYWSAGLITDPDFVKDTRLYMYSRAMGRNIQLAPLSFFPASIISSVMRSYDHLSAGQNYTG